MRFESPDELNRFVTQVRADLQAAGHHAAAERFAAIQGAAFTTGSEWLGELGTAVREVRASCTLSEELDAKLERIRAEVRRVWPFL
jgi:hypothetical protein